MKKKRAEKRFDKIVRDIKSVKIQGARNVAKASLGAYFLFPNEKSRRILLASRPTEPMMENVLAMAKNHSEKNILTHFSQAQTKKLKEMGNELNEKIEQVSEEINKTISETQENELS